MVAPIPIPPQLAASCHEKPERLAWLEALPQTITDLASRWQLQLGEPYTEGTASWVAPARRADGTLAVLKMGMPHMEAEHEIAGLRLWNGAPTVRLLHADDGLNAMLLERCEPGHALRLLREPEQDQVIADLLRRAWRAVLRPTLSVVRPLQQMISYWCDESRAGAMRWPDPALQREGIRVMQALASPSTNDVLLMTDLHAGNVLAATRMPWLAIDPKPFVGDAAYDLTQHLFNCRDRLIANPHALIARMAELCGVNVERARLWTFARLSAEPRDWRQGPDWRIATARGLAP